MPTGRVRFVAGAGGLALATLIVLVGVLVDADGRAAAQTPAPPAATPSAPADAKEQAQAEIGRANAAFVLSLVRTTLVALHQAGMTGNYTVLRDLGTPGFREKNTPTDLGNIFSWLRQLKVDLSAVVRTDVQLSRATLKDSVLDIAGQLAAPPVPVSFQMIFQPIGGTWRLDGLAVAPAQGTNAPAVAAPPAPAPTVAATPAPAPASAPARQKPPAAAHRPARSAAPQPPTPE